MPEATHGLPRPAQLGGAGERLSGRGTETPEVDGAPAGAPPRDELAAQDDFDVVVVNSQLESACAELVSLLVAR